MSDIGPKAHAICDHITTCGGTVSLNNRQFHEFCQKLYDLFPVDELTTRLRAAEAALEAIRRDSELKLSAGGIGFVATNICRRHAALAEKGLEGQRCSA